MAVYDDLKDQYDLINAPFHLLSSSGLADTIFLGPGEEIDFKYVINDTNGNVLIQKTLSLSADNFISLHNFTVNEDYFDYINSLELMWMGGLRPTEENVGEDVQ